MLKIVDIFYSIQGEGSFSGYPCLFIRLHGCDLTCSFCDEDLHKGAYESFTYRQTMQKLENWSSKYVIITGGEPSLHDINEFIKALQSKRYHVAVESNGYKLEHIKSADWITYSPKNWDTLQDEGFSEYKFVVNYNSTIEKILEIKTKKPIYIQPQGDKDSIDKKNTEFCIELVKKHPRLRLSVQLHKYLGVE